MTEPIASTSKLDEETPVDANSNGSAQSHAAGPVGTDDNPNMHFDTTAGKWIYENPETGQELEWNIAANAWLPVVDEDVLQAQQAAYKVEGVDDSVSWARVGNTYNQLKVFPDACRSNSSSR